MSTKRKNIVNLTKIADNDLSNLIKYFKMMTPSSEVIQEKLKESEGIIKKFGFTLDKITEMKIAITFQSLLMQEDLTEEKWDDVQNKKHIYRDLLWNYKAMNGKLIYLLKILATSSYTDESHLKAQIEMYEDIKKDISRIEENIRNIHERL